MNDIAKYRDIIKSILEQEDDDMRDMRRRAAQRKEIDAITKRIQDREKAKPRYDSHRSYANLEYELERDVKDADDEIIYIMVTLEISGEYNKGYSGSRYEPPESPHFEDITLEKIETQDHNPEGGPLTMTEKIKIEKWFESDDGQDYAQEALFKENR